MAVWVRVIGGGALLAGVLLAADSQGHEIVFDVGHTAGGKLKAVFDFDQPVVLPVSIFPTIPGFADAEPAFHSLVIDEPADDAFIPASGGDYRVILVSYDPGVELWNGTGFVPIGGDYDLGPAPFDAHLIWNLLPGAVAGQSYSMVLKLHESGGVYADSDPFTVAFTPVPEPAGAPVVGSLVLLAVAYFDRRARSALTRPAST